MTCQHCAAADDAARRAYQGTLKVLRTERAAATDIKIRNRKLRSIKRILARLAEPPFSGPCTWRPKTNGGHR